MWGVYARWWGYAIGGSVQCIGEAPTRDPSRRLGMPGKARAGEGVGFDKIAGCRYCFGGGPVCLRFSFNTNQAVLHTDMRQTTASPTGSAAVKAANKPWGWHVLGGWGGGTVISMYDTALPCYRNATDCKMARVVYEANEYGDQ